MLKPLVCQFVDFAYSQPPSGGCVLKHVGLRVGKSVVNNQPPSGGCVLKPLGGLVSTMPVCQPPSGGCVLKQQPTGYAVDCVFPSRLQAAVC